MRKVKTILFVTLITLVANLQTVYGWSFDTADSEETLLTIGKVLGLVLLVKCITSFGGRAVDGVKNLINEAQGKGYDAEERRRVREHERLKKQREREAKRSRKQSGYGNNNNKSDIPLEPLALLIGGAFAAGDWIGEKACAAGKWIKGKVTTGVNAARAAKAPTPKNVGRLANSAEEEKSRKGGQ